MNTAVSLVTPDVQATKKWLIITVMMVAILEVLDSTIVNVALPHMMTALNASQNTITWTITAYMVSAAIIIPITGFLSDRLGQRRLLLISVTGFMIGSFLCGTATSLDEMLLFRMIQGMCGATLVPLSQAILRNSFPKEEQGRAMTIWGLGIMAAPICGPTLGGLITQYASWRWVFYINMPFCIIALFLTLWVIPQTPLKKRTLDRLGLLLMIIGILSLQLLLDQGYTQDWFQSHIIQVLAITSAISLTLFIIRTVHHQTPLVNLQLYKNRNFSICCALLLCFCGLVFSVITIEPIMLQTLFHNTSFLAGLYMAPIGLASGCGMILVMLVIKHIRVRWILLLSALLCSSSSYLLSTFTLATNMNHMMIANACLGLGMGMFFGPISTYALLTLSKDQMTEGSGLFSYNRMLGSSIGIALISTYVSEHAQVKWHQLAGHVTETNPAYHQWLSSFHQTVTNPSSMATLGQQIVAHSQFMSYIDTFRLLSLAFLLTIPLTFALAHVNLSQKDQP